MEDFMKNLSMEKVIKHKHFIWGVLAVLFLLYNASCFINLLPHTQVRQHVPEPPKPNPHAAEEQAKAKAEADAVAQAAKNATLSPYEPADGPFMGNWRGTADLPGRGTPCVLTLEVKSGADADHPVSGFAKMQCNIDQNQWIGKGHLSPDMLRDIAATKNPVASSMTGKAQANGLAFTVEKNLDVDVAYRGCPMSTLTLTPFGTGKIAAEWKDATDAQAFCHGGQMVLDYTR